MKLEYIKANGKYYKPQEAKIKIDKFKNHPVCTIKKLLFGFWQIDYYCLEAQYKIKGDFSCSRGDEDTPNKRVILYPWGIEEISYFKQLGKL